MNQRHIGSISVWFLNNGRLNNETISNSGVFHHNGNAWSYVKAFLWPISFVHALPPKPTSTSQESNNSLETNKTLYEKEHYICIRYDHVLPNLGVLVNDTVPVYTHAQHKQRQWRMLYTTKMIQNLLSPWRWFNTPDLGVLAYPYRNFPLS